MPDDILIEKKNDFNYKPRAAEAERGRLSQAQGQCTLHSQFQTNQDHTETLAFKKINKTENIP